MRNEQCKYFMNGNCMKGRFCLFKHEHEGHLYNRINGRFTGQNYNQNTYQRQCKFGINCFKFPDCGFVHNEVCRYQERCFKQGNCSFVHLNSNNFLGGTRPM